MQEQAISLVRNLVNGDPESVEQIFSDGGMLFQAIEKQLINPRPEISVQVRSYAAFSFLISILLIIDAHSCCKIRRRGSVACTCHYLCLLSVSLLDRIFL